MERFHLLIVLSCWGALVLGIGTIAKDRPIDVVRVSAVYAVPVVATFEPWELTCHGGEQVVK